MAGTREGGLKAAATNKSRHGADFYKKIGTKGGQNGHTGGFAANRELARIAGTKGSRMSKRPPAYAVGKAPMWSNVENLEPIEAPRRSFIDRILHR